MPHLLPPLLVPANPGDTKILYLAEYAPDHPIYDVKPFKEDGGYPEYHFDIFDTLMGIGYDARSSSKPYSIMHASGNVDFIFSLLNRMPFKNSEIFVSAYCEFIRLPYLGAPPNIRALAEDKYLTKLFCEGLSIPVPKGRVYRPGDDTAAPRVPGPYFIKDRTGAGSEGIFSENLQEEWSGAKRVIQRFHDSGKDALVESYCPGIDVTVSVLGNAPYSILGFVSPVSDKVGGILTEDLKMTDHLGYVLTDVGDLEGEIRGDIDAIWQAAGPMDYFRVDYRIDFATGRRWLLEFNLCCYLGGGGAICLAGSQHGYSKSDIIAHVVEYSLKRQIGSRKHCQWVL